MSVVRPTHSSDGGYDAKDVEDVAKGTYETSSSKPSSLRLGEGEGGVFATGANADLYKPIEKYEGAHRYDPKFEWSEKEEKKLVRRVRATCPKRWPSRCQLYGAASFLSSSSLLDGDKLPWRATNCDTEDCSST